MLYPLKSRTKTNRMRDGSDDDHALSHEKREEADVKEKVWSTEQK